MISPRCARHAVVERLESRLQLSAALSVKAYPAAATGGELAGPSSVAFGDLAVGDTSDNEQQVTVTNVGSQSVQLDNPYSHDTTQVTLDASGFPVGEFLDPGSSASFDVIVNTTDNLTVSTTATVEYNDGASEYLDIPVTAMVGSGSNPDTTAPTAKISYAKALRVPTKYYYFAVTYTDDVAVEASTLDSSDIVVSRKHYPTLHANFISASPDSDSASITAVYAVRYGPRGTWTSAYDGLWTFSLAAGQVTDTSGNAAAAVTLGQVAFLIPATTAATALAQVARPAIPSIFSSTPIASTDAVWDRSV